MTFLEIKQRIAKYLRGIFDQEFADDAALNEAIEVQISMRNLPMV